MPPHERILFCRQHLHVFVEPHLPFTDCKFELSLLLDDCLFSFYDEVPWCDCFEGECDVNAILAMNLSKANISKSSSSVGLFAEKPPLSLSVLLPGVADKAASTSAKKNFFSSEQAPRLCYLNAFKKWFT